MTVRGPVSSTSATVPAETAALQRTPPGVSTGPAEAGSESLSVPAAHCSFRPGTGDGKQTAAASCPPDASQLQDSRCAGMGRTAEETPGTGSSGSPAAERSLTGPTLLMLSAIGFALIAFALWAVRFIGWIRALNGSAPLWLAVGVITVSLRWCLLLGLSYRSLRKRSRDPLPEVTDWPHVSILIPAYNEEETIVPALESLLALDYPCFDAIVIDDGSPDATFERACEFARQHPELPVKIFRKPNGGKWAAHNFGFRRTTGELVLCLDADSRLRPGSLRHLVRRMADPEVAAVAGQVCVRERHNLVTRLQALEYLMANGALRLAQNTTGHVLVVPGPIGLFRRDVMEEVFVQYVQHGSSLEPGQVAGPFEGNTFAEDFDLSLAVLAMGHKTIYEPEAVSDTKAPDNILDLLNQRYRWARGSLQVVRKFLRHSSQHGGPARLPALHGWICVCYVAEIAMFPFVYGMSLAGLWPALVHPASVGIMASGLALIWGLNASIAGLYVAVHRDDYRLLLVIPLLDFYFGVLLSAGLVFALFDEWRNTRMKW